jgi:hypothetical protein
LSAWTKTPAKQNAGGLAMLRLSSDIESAHQMLWNFDVRLAPKADIRGCSWNVRFVPTPDIGIPLPVDQEFRLTPDFVFRFP